MPGNPIGLEALTFSPNVKQNRKVLILVAYSKQNWNLRVAVFITNACSSRKRLAMKSRGLL